MKTNLTKWQTKFLNETREHGEPVRFYVSDSLTEKRLTIRVVELGGGDSYFLTIANEIDPDSKLTQVRHFVKTGADIGCEARREEVEEFEIPF